MSKDVIVTTEPTESTCKETLEELSNGRGEN